MVTMSDGLYSTDKKYNSVIFSYLWVHRGVHSAVRVDVQHLGRGLQRLGWQQGLRPVSDQRSVLVLASGRPEFLPNGLRRYKDVLMMT